MGNHPQIIPNHQVDLVDLDLVNLLDLLDLSCGPGEPGGPGKSSPAMAELFFGLPGFFLGQEKCCGRTIQVSEKPNLPR